MGRYIGPKTKIARKFGEAIFGTDKALEKKNYPPGQHGLARKRKKVSEYGTQLLEKQKAKIPKFGKKTKSMIDSSTAQSLTEMMANNVENKYGSDMFPGLNVCAKSGTAEVGGNKRPNAWFTGFLDDPEHPYAFIVLVENGGHGAQVAGSVANKVLQSAVNR